MTPLELLECARQARKHAYCPYSDYAVGAALLAKNGRVYLGCNLENAAYPAALCAERAAFARAVSQGVRAFEAIAIAGGPSGEEAVSPCPPCGLCRQVMRELCDESFRILLADGEESFRSFSLGELLPGAFGPEQLK